jgi:CubicO group peptidase (beta-lactamase class C family)
MRLFLMTILALLAWAALVVTGTIGGWWRAPLAAHGNTEAFRDAAIVEINRTYKGNVAFVLLERGQVRARHFASIGEPVNGDSRFQVASLSKWVTAWGIFTLVEAGKLDLDKPVSSYLTRWKLPKGPFDNDGVTIRRLLSHTAGLTDGLGYAGFKPGQPLQRLEDSLTRAADASPGAEGAVRVGIKPGSAFKYSGGGYTLLQLLIEEVSGQSFDAYMKAHVLDRLGMERSTFKLPDAEIEDVAAVYDTRGARAIHYRFTAQAAAALYTTSDDMTRFLQAHVRGANGEVAGRGVLKPATLVEMRQPHAAQMGADIWGLGTMLFAPNNRGGFIIGHDGNNEPAINTAARLDPDTGDGIIVLETGNKLLATQIASEWVFWRTGSIDFLMFMFELGDMLTILAAGSVVIILAGLIAGWRRWARYSTET